MRPHRLAREKPARTPEASSRHTLYVWISPWRRVGEKRGRVEAGVLPLAGARGGLPLRARWRRPTPHARPATRASWPPTAGAAVADTAAVRGGGAVLHTHAVAGTLPFRRRADSDRGAAAGTTHARPRAALVDVGARRSPRGPTMHDGGIRSCSFRVVGRLPPAAHYFVLEGQRFHAPKTTPAKKRGRNPLVRRFNLGNREKSRLKDGLRHTDGRRTSGGRRTYKRWQGCRGNLAEKCTSAMAAQ